MTEHAATLTNCEHNHLRTLLNRLLYRVPRSFVDRVSCPFAHIWPRQVGQPLRHFDCLLHDPSPSLSVFPCAIVPLAISAPESCASIGGDKLRF